MAETVWLESMLLIVVARARMSSVLEIERLLRETWECHRAACHLAQLKFGPRQTYDRPEARFCLLPPSTRPLPQSFPLDRRPFHSIRSLINTDFARLPQQTSTTMDQPSPMASAPVDQGYKAPDQPTMIAEAVTPVVNPNWENDLWSCFDPTSTCCMGFWCPVRVFDPLLLDEG
jgi:hypothetical protein